MSTEPGPGGDRDGRRLERAPSERYRRTRSGELDGQAEANAGRELAAAASPGRGVLFGLVGALIGVSILVVFGAVFSYSVGLLVVAFFLGRIVGYTVRAGALDSLSSATRVSVSILIVLAGLTIAQLAIWVWSRIQGGSLDPWPFLLDTYGPLLPLEYMTATLTAWWSGR